MQDIGIYIHIPFCKSKCFYCAFNSIDCTKAKVSSKLIDDYFKALSKEIISKAELLSTSKCNSIYIGGGTPSYVDESYIKDVLYLIKNICNLSKDCEITIEINPGTLTLEKAKVYKEIGINRVSLGMQTLNDNTLKKIGRMHTRKDFYDAIDILTKAKFDNISCDYIFGLPDQTIESAESEFKELFKLPLKHISSYDLEVIEGTKLDFLVENGYITLPTDDDIVDIREHVQKMLKEQMFIQYEISNYCKEGYHSRHNVNYWKQGSYIGLGVSASSYINGVRYTNIASIPEYIENINSFKKIYNIDEEMDKLSTMKEYMMLGFRLASGVNTLEFKNKFKENLEDLFKQELDKCIENKLVVKEENNYKLTTKGKELANVVFREFI